MIPLLTHNRLPVHAAHGEPGAKRALTTRPVARLAQQHDVLECRPYPNVACSHSQTWPRRFAAATNMRHRAHVYRLTL